MTGRLRPLTDDRGGGRATTGARDPLRLIRVPTGILWDDKRRPTVAGQREAARDREQAAAADRRRVGAGKARFEGM